MIEIAKVSTSVTWEKVKGQISHEPKRARFVVNPRHLFIAPISSYIYSDSHLTPTDLRRERRLLRSEALLKWHQKPALNWMLVSKVDAAGFQATWPLNGTANLNLELMLDVLSGEPKKLKTKTDMVATLPTRYRAERSFRASRAADVIEIKLDGLYHDGLPSWDDAKEVLGEEWVTPRCMVCDSFVEAIWKFDENVEICERCLRHALDRF